MKPRTNISILLTSKTPTLSSLRTPPVPVLSTPNRNIVTAAHVRHVCTQRLSALKRFPTPFYTHFPASFSTAAAQATCQMNPLLTPSPLQFEYPDFSAIKFEHFEPAIMQGMAEHIQEIAAIANNSEPPTFENTLEALERAGRLFSRATDVFFNLAGTDSTEEIRDLEDKLAPLLAKHSDDLHLNATLFARIEAVYNQRTSLSLNTEQMRLVEKYYRDFVRAGARLSAEDQAKLRAMNEELSALSNKFSQTLLAVEEEDILLFDDEAALAGLDEADIATAKSVAVARGHEGKFALTLTNTTRHPQLASLANRDTRKKLWELSNSRASSGPRDTTPIVQRVVQLRAERAALLGYDTFAAYVLEKQMAKTPAAALAMLDSMVPAVVANVHAEKRAIAEVMIEDLRARGELAADAVVDVASVDVQPWDWEFYSEKVRAARYALDENAVKQYLPFERVLEDGVFFTFNKLYGITFRPRPDLPVYHPDVRVWDVVDEAGETIAIFIGDYFKRKGKQGGAWMNCFREPARLLDQKPVIVNVMNIAKPASGPVLVSYDEATTIFHEKGHGVHSITSFAVYPTLSGTNVPLDFVEMPSTVHEDWAMHPAVITNYARHHATGQPLPADLLQKILASRCFNQGFDTLEYLSAAIIDMEWHMLDQAQVAAVFQRGGDAIAEFEREVLAKHGIAEPCVPPRYRTRFFSHSMGGYCAGYYAYMWSEIFAADAHAHMVAAGGPNREVGERLRREVLERGNTRDVMESYVAFRGCEPTSEALLIRRGISPKSEESKADC